MKELHGERAAVPPDRTRDIGQSLELRVVPKAWEAQRRVDRVLVDQVTAENDHSQTGLGAFFVVGDRLLGENPLVRAPDPGWCTAVRRRHVGSEPSSRIPQMARADGDK